MAPKSDSDRKKKKGRLNVAIRDMEIDDLAPVFHLGEKLFRANVVPNLYRTWDEYEVTALFQEDSGFCLVAELEEQIVAFALGTTIDKAHSAWSYGHLIWLGVDPEVQGLGVGEKLFLHFKERMVEEGVKILIVDSEADNLPALHFFRKMGFGSPKEHIYLSLNLATQRRQTDLKKNGGR